MAKPVDPEKPGRIKQLRMIAKIIQQANPKGMPIVFLSAVATLAVVIVIGLVTGWIWYSIFIGIMLAFTVGLIVFGQLAQRAQYSMLDGQTGAGRRGAAGHAGQLGGDPRDRRQPRPGPRAPGGGLPRHRAGLRGAGQPRAEDAGR
ncbi:hypothetical protein GCM10020219_040810 [Nonomuraea dietziae]